MRRFSGLLLPGDVLSDRAPMFSDGKRVVITRGALQRALPTLIGTELNCAVNFDGHAPDRPIGRISHGFLVAGFLYITGELYREWDTPEFAERVSEGDLGLSAELADAAYLEHVGARVVGVHTLTFTGAAVVKKSSAAWSLTDFRLADAAEAAVAA